MPYFSVFSCLAKLQKFFNYLILFSQKKKKRESKVFNPQFLRKMHSIFRKYIENFLKNFSSNNTRGLKCYFFFYLLFYFKSEGIFQLFDVYFSQKKLGESKVLRPPFSKVWKIFQATQRALNAIFFSSLVLFQIWRNFSIIWCFFTQKDRQVKSLKTTVFEINE